MGFPRTIIFKFKYTYHRVRLTPTGFGSTSILWAGFGYSGRSWALVKWAGTNYLGPRPPTNPLSNINPKFDPTKDLLKYPTFKVSLSLSLFFFFPRITFTPTYNNLVLWIHHKLNQFITFSLWYSKAKIVSVYTNFSLITIVQEQLNYEKFLFDAYHFDPNCSNLPYSE